MLWSLTSTIIHSIRELGTWVFLRNAEMEQFQIIIPYKPYMFGGTRQWNS
jgi:hypothetical protein